MGLQIRLEDLWNFRRVAAVQDAMVSEDAYAAVKRLHEKEDLEPLLRDILSDPNQTPHGPTEIADIITTCDLGGQPVTTAFVLKGRSFPSVSSKHVAHQFFKLRTIPDLKLMVLLAVGDIQDDARRDFAQSATDHGCRYLIIDRHDVARLLVAYEKICPKDGLICHDGLCPQGHRVSELLCRTEGKNKPYPSRRQLLQYGTGTITYRASEPTVYLEAFLPTYQRPSGSCTIYLQGRDVAFTLDHKAIVQQLFPGLSTPVDGGRRGFMLQGPNSRTEYSAMLGSASPTLSSEEATQLCQIVDDLVREYVKALMGVERISESRWFDRSTEHDSGYRVARVSTSLWNRMVDFAVAHDADQGHSEWHIFDGNERYIKVFTRQGTERYDAGYHVFLYPELDTPWYLVSDRNEYVWVVCVSPHWSYEDEREVIGSRRYWTTQMAHDWLMHEFIPAVCAQNPGSSGRPTKFPFCLAPRSRRKAAEPAYSFLSCERERCPQPDSVRTSKDLLGLSTHLQRFFACTRRSFDLNDEMAKAIHRAVALCLLRTPLEDYSYIKGNLTFSVTGDSPGTIYDSIERRAQEVRAEAYSSSTLDRLLRCIVVPLRDARSQLDSKEAREIAGWLQPFYEEMELQGLLARFRG